MSTFYGGSNHLYTHVSFDNMWLNAPYNFARWARNRYGKNCLKHTQSWQIHKFKHSFEEYPGGKFKSDAKCLSHFCLQMFPTDGNKDFYIT